MSPVLVRQVRERRVAGEIPLFVHPEWAERFAWLIQGTTGRGEGGYDFGLSGETPVRLALARWRALRDATGALVVAHAHQVHGADLLRHEGGPEGIHISDRYDGHLTRTPGVLLTVSIADCVPVSLVAPDAQALALLHAGWRGAAAGILEAGIKALAALADADASDLLVHLGPAICGACYEVGPEVHRVLGMPEPAAPQPVDLRAVIAARALTAGIRPESITLSSHCTRCGGGEEASAFFSHRGGEAGRQVGVLGVRWASGEAGG